MSIVLKQFKKLGDEYYRIDWIGDVVTRSLKAAATPSVNVVLSQRQTLDATHCDEKFAQIHLIVPIAFLRLLRVGDFWKSGQRVMEGAGEHVCFSDVRISRTTVDVRPVGLPITVDDETLYLLPFDQYSSHRQHTGSYAARVRVDETTFILVPCMELIRFYFGASGALLSRLFSGPITGDDLYESATLNSKNVAHIKLSKGIPGVAAATVARIALDLHAEKAVNWIVNSGVRSAANGTLYYPTTIFPFEGTSTLKVVGNWIKVKDFNVFVTDRLMSCSHPFPFSSMFYELHSSHKMHDATDNDSSSDEKNRSTSKEEESALDEGSVKSSLAVKTIFYDENSEAFPDLSRKSIRKIAYSIASSFAHRGSNDLPLAIGPQEIKGSYRGGDVSTKYEPEDIAGPVSGPMALLLAVEILHGIRAIDFSLHPLPGLFHDGTTPFRPIKYVRSIDEHKFPVIIGTRLLFSNAKRSGEFLILTFESKIEKLERHTAIISGCADANSNHWTLIDLWNAACLLSGINTVVNLEIESHCRFIASEEATDPMSLAKILLPMTFSKNTKK